MITVEEQKKKIIHTTKSLQHEAILEKDLCVENITIKHQAMKLKCKMTQILRLNQIQAIFYIIKEMNYKITKCFNLT